MLIRTIMQKGRTRAYMATGLATLLVSLALVVATAPATLYAAPHGGAGLSQGMMSVVFDTNLVSRGQLAQKVSNAAGFHEDPGSQVFEDVPPDSHFYDWVNRLAHRDVVGGFECGSVPDEPCVPPDNRPYFRPDANATRGQAAKVISNSAGFNDTPTGQTFEDVLPGSTFYEFVERLASRGLITGFECGVDPAGPCVAPENRPYFLPFDLISMDDLTKVVNDTFHGNGE